MKNILKNINQDKKLEVIIKDCHSNTTYANRILADSYIENMIEIYFSRQEDNNCDNLRVKDLYKLLSQEDFKKIDLTFDFQEDNYSVDNYTIDEYEDKVVLTLIVDVDISDGIPYLEIACNYANTADIEDIVDFIYEDFKSDIYRYLNIKLKADLLVAMDEENNENTMNYLVSFIENKIKKMSNFDLNAFAINHYDSDFNKDAVA